MEGTPQEQSTPQTEQVANEQPDTPDLSQLQSSQPDVPVDPQPTQVDPPEDDNDGVQEALQRETADGVGETQPTEDDTDASSDGSG